MIWRTCFFLKEGQSSAFVPWHQDAYFYRLNPHDVLTAWVALTPSVRANGCLKVVRGSHREPELRRHELSVGQGNVLLRGQDIPEFNEADEDVVSLELQPGEGVQFELAYAPQDEGGDSCSLAVYTNFTDSPAAVVPLSGGEYELLVAFATHPGRVLSRDQLLDMAHNRDWEPFDRSIDIRIARIRRKIEADHSKPQVIKTVRGAGYIFSPGGA